MGKAGKKFSKIKKHLRKEMIYKERKAGKKLASYHEKKFKEKKHKHIMTKKTIHHAKTAVHKIIKKVHKAKKTIHGGFKEKMAKEAKAKHRIKHKLVKRRLFKH